MRDVGDILHPACPTISRLKEIGPVKVWSLLVTVFGDLASAHDGHLSGAQLTRLFEAMGIRGEALRVALHRLRKEGWIISERRGRTSDYSMSAKGLWETAAARARVYRGPDEGPCRWHLLLTRGAVPEGAIRLRNGAALRPAGSPPACPDAWVIPMSVGEVPEWVAEDILPRGLTDVATDLVAVLQSRDDPPSQVGGPYQRMAERILILHQWRRLALREGTWLMMSLQPEGVVAQCCTAVQRALADMPVAALP
ncbi:MAG: hypothetical protein AAF982_02195 [Pseudomonadota bacterium]